MLELLPGLPIYAVDQKIKEECEEKLESGKSKDILGGHARLILHHNYGSAGNMGAGNPKRVKIISVVLTMVVAATFAFSVFDGWNRAIKCGLSLVLGGAFSNTYDRLKHGYVIDYIGFNHGPQSIRRLIWNIADFSIIIGAIIAVMSGSKDM